MSLSFPLEILILPEAIRSDIQLSVVNYFVFSAESGIFVLDSVEAVRATRDDFLCLRSV